MRKRGGWGKRFFIGVHALILFVGLAVFLFVSVEADKAAGENVFFVYPKTPSAPAFTAEDINVMQGTLAKLTTDAAGQGGHHSYVFSYESTATYFVQNGTAQVYCRVTTTNHAYAGMHRLSFAEGAFYGEAAAQTRVAVLSEALAWRLLGVTDTVGREITIGGEVYTVVGVVTESAGGYSQDAAAYSGMDAYYAYIPPHDGTAGASGAASISDASVANLYIQSWAYSWLTDAENINAALRAAYRNPADYGVCDLNLYIQTVNNRPILLLAVASILALLVLVWRILYEVKRLSGKHNDDMRAAGARNTAIRNICLLALAAVPLVVCIQTGIGALPHVPGGGLADIVAAVFNHDALPGAAYVTGAVLRLRVLNATSAAAFAACLAVVVELVLFVCASETKNA